MSWPAVAGRWLWRTFLCLIALFMLVVILGVGYWGWTTFEERRLERRISVARAWPSTEILVSVGKNRVGALKASVKTRCSERVLYYILTITKNDAVKIDEDFEDLARRVSEYRLELLDGDNFKISSITISRQETTRLVGDSGRVEAREANASTTCERSAYARVSRVAVGWHEAQ